ncbi:hypothetical protein F4861DRAFT_102869 [Xylaria intraflava]|nr:hypothetical protein F4861DRAFT_102869 [Xylaria intraflava]
MADGALDGEEYNGLLGPGETGSDGRGDIKSHSRKEKMLVRLLLVSCLLNLVLAIALLALSRDAELPPSKYAKLRRTREEPYVFVSRYASENQTLQEQLWHDINVDNGYVALSDDWAVRNGLRKAQRFPWDQSKGLYILHGYHNLHCLKRVYISLAEHRRGDAQSISWEHISHCLDALRRQILCDADDTPRVTDRRMEVVSGVLQHRRCRNWGELDDFARRHTACYKRPENPEQDPLPSIESFKHCPPGTGYVYRDDYVPTDELISGLPAESVEF